MKVLTLPYAPSTHRVAVPWRLRTKPGEWVRHRHGGGAPRCDQLLLRRDLGKLGAYPEPITSTTKSKRPLQVPIRGGAATFAVRRLLLRMPRPGSGPTSLRGVEDSSRVWAPGKPVVRLPPAYSSRSEQDHRQKCSSGSTETCCRCHGTRRLLITAWRSDVLPDVSGVRGGRGRGQFVTSNPFERVPRRTHGPRAPSRFRRRGRQIVSARWPGDSTFRGGSRPLRRS